MHRIEREAGWAAAMAIAVLAITALATAALTLTSGPAGAVVLQDEDEEEVEISTAGNRLVFDVKRSTGSFEASPDGTFVHASSGASLSFDKGELLRFKGSDEETRPAEVERVAVRDGQVLIYLEGNRGKAESRPVPLEDGAWTNRQAGTSFVVEDGSIIKCGGFEPKS